MKVLFVYKEDYPWDVRVEKIVTTLADAGHDVTILARNNRRLPSSEDAGTFSVRRLPALPRWFGPLNGLVGVPLFLNPVWLLALWRALTVTGARMIVVRDLPLMLGVLLVARVFACRTVFDMAECYPEMYKSMLMYNPGRIRNWIVRNPAIAALFERVAVAGASHTLVMIEESRDRLLAMGFDSQKITIVSNTPPLDGRPLREHHSNEVLRLLYVGFVTRIRGLDNLLRGLKAYLERDPEARPVEFHVVGVGSALAEYRFLTKRLEITSNVHFHGWLDQKSVDALYAYSDVGVLTYHRCSHWDHTIPNKLFDYMFSGMPVLATDIRPIRRIVEQDACGIIVPDGDDEACRLAIARLQDAALRKRMGHRGRQAVLERYNWGRDGARLLKVVDRQG
jgi:glycosyltransferase involved in cell wall biosynthesis